MSICEANAFRSTASSDATRSVAVRIWILAILIACGPKPAPEAPQNSEPAVKDTRTPFEIRRDDACEHIAPKLTQCAVEDAKNDFAAGKTTKQQLDADTSAEVQHKNSQMFIDKCKGWRDMSSRQIRVLEVCDREETQCGPLNTCLANMKAQK